MSSSVQFNLMAGFKAVEAWQRNLMRNAQGLLQPGYNATTQHLGASGAGSLSASQTPTSVNGGRNGGAAGDALMVGGISLNIKQGDFMPNESATALAIKGPGFFLLAENLKPGARLFLSRAGDFHYDPQGRLVNSQGLFVVGGGGTLTDPPTAVYNPGDGSVVLPQLTLGRVPVPNNMALSAYGPTVYQLTGSSGPLQAFANGRQEVGFVQTKMLEVPSRIGSMNEIAIETTAAQQTYKMFKDMLDSYNRMVDDAIQTAGR